MRFRQIIPEIMAFLTSHPRYLPKDIEWSPKSWTHNVFRVYEMIFWRREGIRQEFAVWQNKDGSVHRKTFTVEAAIAYFETDVREFVASFKPQRDGLGHLTISPIQIQNLKQVGRVMVMGMFAFLGTTHGLPMIMLAIAFGAYTKGTGSTSPNTLSVTTSGSDRWLNSCSFRNGNGQTVTGTTYNSVAMTSPGTDTSLPNNGYYGADLWYLANPTTGANNLVTAWTGGSNVFQYALGYTGVVNTGISGQSSGQVSYSGLAAFRSFTPSAANGWVCWFGSGDGSQPAAVYNLTGTMRSTVPSSDWCAADSNGTVAVSAVSYGYTNGSGSVGSLSILGFGIASAAGPANVKTWDGVTQSTGIKTYLGLALASVKTVIGLN